MKTNCSLNKLLAVLLGVMPLAGCQRGLTPTEQSARLAQATNILFTWTGENKPKSLAVSNTSAFRRILTETPLAAQEPCACAHQLEGVFSLPKGTVKVSFCGHCMDIQEEKGVSFHSMPPAFYAEFLKLAQSAPGGPWPVE